MRHATDTVPSQNCHCNCCCASLQSALPSVCLSVHSSVNFSCAASSSSFFMDFVIVSTRIANFRHASMISLVIGIQFALSIRHVVHKLKFRNLRRRLARMSGAWQGVGRRRGQPFGFASCSACLRFRQQLVATLWQHLQTNICIYLYIVYMYIDSSAYLYAFNSMLRN